MHTLDDVIRAAVAAMVPYRRTRARFADLRRALAVPPFLAMAFVRGLDAEPRAKSPHGAVRVTVARVSVAP
ncbi:hypothetical protein ACIBI3_15615 [Actinomadura luteofluorescens]|uniref:hypothetical protein n=1 Tax=Actinomadura luteofluorescens TaxID=46163 RepID=UPI0034744C38